MSVKGWDEENAAECEPEHGGYNSELDEDY